MDVEGAVEKFANEITDSVIKAIRSTMEGQPVDDDVKTGLASLIMIRVSVKLLKRTDELKAGK